MYLDTKSITDHLSVIKTRTGHTPEDNDVSLLLDLLHSGMCIMLAMDYTGGKPDELRITLRFRHKDKAAVIDLFTMHEMVPFEQGESMRTNIFFVSINIGAKDIKPASTVIRKESIITLFKNKVTLLLKK